MLKCLHMTLFAQLTPAHDTQSTLAGLNIEILTHFGITAFHFFNLWVLLVERSSIA